MLSGTASGAGALSAAFAAGDTLNVDGTTLTFVTGAAGANQISTTGTVADLLAAIDTASGNTGTGTTPSSIAGGVITLHTGTANGVLSITSSNAAALTALGLGSGVSQPAGGSTPQLCGQTLIIAATGGGTATNITFGTGTGQVSTLNQLNAALAANNLQASISTTGAITIMTSATTRLRRRSARSPARLPRPALLPRPGRAPIRCSIRTRRPPAPAWSRSTTTSCSRSTPRRRTPPSTASTC